MGADSVTCVDAGFRLSQTDFSFPVSTSDDVAFPTAGNTSTLVDNAD
jgi:hypothetical protein